ISRGSYLFRVTYLGMATFSKKIEPDENESIVELGVIMMKSKSQELNEVVIEAEKVPVVVKGDTLEFNASSFKTTENANVEDLLKKLPGVEVASDGTIKAQGEQVQRVTVDGKEFFGRDPKLATRNLPAKAIDKVQVFDKKSDQSTFTGIDDGQREKTINLEMKEEYRKGMFGNITGGIGTSERYQAKLSLNRFRKDSQFSILGSANNINDQGFSIDDYLNFSGSSQQMAGGGGGARITINGGGGNGDGNQGGAQVNFGNRITGIMSSYSGGINFNKEISKKASLTSSYFYNYLDHAIDKNLDRENFLQSGNTFFNQQSRQRNSNSNHRANLILDHKIDSANSVKLTTTLVATESESDVNSKSDTKTSEVTALNESDRTTLSNQNSVNFNTNALLRHRFEKKGRTISANLSFGYTDTEAQGKLDAINEYYTENRTETIDQRNSQATKNTSYGLNLSYTEPLGNRKYLELYYNFRGNLNDANREVYDINDIGEDLNSDLSNKYSSNYQYNRPGFNFKINRENYSVTVGTGLQVTQLTGKFISESIPRDTSISRAYQNIVPALHFNYDFANTKHLNFDYETSVQEPSITQLQPVVNNTDPLNLTAGNPALRPAYQHSWRLRFIAFDPAKFINFFAFANATYSQNAITNSQTIDSSGVRLTIPVNVDHNTSLNGNVAFGFPITKLSSRFNLSVNVSQQFGLNLVNLEETSISVNAISSTLRYDYHYKEIFDLNLSGTISRNSTQYEFNPQSDQLYFNNDFKAEANYSFLKNYQLSASYEFLRYKSQTANYDQNVELLNISVSRFLLKNKSGEFKLSVNNLLDNNFGISQTANVNYVERQTTNSLGRYYMVTFIYALNKHMNPMGAGRSRGGMRMMIRQ
ncbi:MAG TPA: outer membrane beta-barrel protein, partial [Chryseolinea sp.]|nr:outer membrane beta-barrel protein [Chryseolinea sp.]